MGRLSDILLGGLVGVGGGSGAAVIQNREQLALQRQQEARAQQAQQFEMQQAQQRQLAQAQQAQQLRGLSQQLFPQGGQQVPPDVARGALGRLALQGGDIGRAAELAQPPVRRAPQTRTRIEGLDKVVEQFDPSTGTFFEVSRGPRAAQTGAAPFPGGKAPTGFRFLPDGSLEPIPGGPKARQTPEQAGKTQLVEQASREWGRLKSMIIRPDGSVDRGLVAQMANLPGAAPGLPFTSGRTARVLFSDSAEAKLRAETGAAATEAEINRITDRFLPRLTDPDETIRTKMNAMDDFLSGTIRKIDPTGSFTEQEGVITVAGQPYEFVPQGQEPDVAGDFSSLWE